MQYLAKIRDFVTITQQEFFDGKKGSLWFRISAAVLALIAFGTLFWFVYALVLFGDEREHISASFFIYDGQIPYRDFFEHHHPLFWYSLLPILVFLNNSSYIWYVARGYMLLITFINSFVVYKISKLISFNKAFLFLAVVFSVCSHCIYIAQITIRPDALMTLTLFSGIYFLFRYFKGCCDKDLNISFIFFFLSFLTSQKVVLFLPSIGVLLIYNLIKKNISFKSICEALFIPLICCFALIGLMYHANMLKDYWELNWLLNIKARHLVLYPIVKSAWFTIANLIALFLLVTKQHRFLKYIAFLCLSYSFILVFKGRLVQYWLPLYPLFAIISAYAVCRLKDILRVIVLLFIIVFTFLNNRYYAILEQRSPYLDFFEQKTRLVLAATTGNDYVLSNLAILGGLRRDAAGYYWFGRDYMALIDNYYFNRHPLPDINEIIRKKKPKIIPREMLPVCINPDLTNTDNCFNNFSYDWNFIYENYEPYDIYLKRKDTAVMPNYRQ